MSFSKMSIRVVALLVLMAGCVTHRPPVPPPVDRTAEFTETCRVLYELVLERAIDADGAAECLRLARNGFTGEDLRRWLETSAEYAALQERKKLPRALPGLQVLGREFYTSHGEKFHWLFVTGFALLDQVADGRTGEAEAFLAWARETGFNGVRVLATATGLFQLSADEGRRALPALLTLLQRYQLRMELVALVDTAAWSDAQLREQVQALAVMCAVHTHCSVFQVANEHYHATQSRSLHDQGFLHSLAPSGVVYTLSPASSDEADEPGGQYFTRHLDRSRDPWNMVRRVRELEGLSARRGVPVVNDEIIGAGEVDDRGRRLANPAIFFTFGALSRVFDVGTTFHCQDCLYARVPGPRQQESARAFIAGARSIPTDARLTFKNAGWADSPVESANFNNVVRAYSGVLGGQAWTVLVGVNAAPEVRWRAPWRPVRVVGEMPQVQVWEVTR